MVNPTDAIHPVPAHVVPHTSNDFGVCVPTGNNYTGVTLRTELAARAMQGLLSNPAYAGAVYHEIACIAVQQTDALIAELNKTSDNG